MRLLPEHSEQGRLFVFEGVDGSGKTTILDLVQKELGHRGLEPLVTRQPTTEARELPLFQRFLFQPEERHRIDFRALLCFMIGDRLQHVQDVIRPALASGRVVLCDRYLFTMIATMHARGFAAEEVWVAASCREVPRPDAALLFDAPVEVIIDRLRARGSTREGYVERAHLERTRGAFKSLAAAGHLELIDTSSADPAGAFAEAWRKVDRLLPRPASSPRSPSAAAAPLPAQPT